MSSSSSSSTTRPSTTTKLVSPSSEGASGLVSVPPHLERFRLGYAASITQSPLHILSATRHKRVCVCDSDSFRSFVLSFVRSFTLSLFVCLFGLFGRVFLITTEPQLNPLCARRYVTTNYPPP